MPVPLEFQEAEQAGSDAGPAQGAVDPPYACSPHSPAAGPALGGGFSSQPLPAVQQAAPAPDLLSGFGSAPISPFAERARQRRSSASSASRGSGSGGPGALPLPSLTEEDRALLDAIDSTGPPPQPCRPSAQPVAGGQLPGVQQLQRMPGRQSDSGQVTHAAPPLRERSHLAQAATLGASPSHNGAVDLSHARSLEHALHLAAEAAMGGDSLLARGGGASRDGSVAAASHSSAGPPSGASTSRQPSMLRWDSQSLPPDGQLVRAGSSAPSTHSRHSGGQLRGESAALFWERAGCGVVASCGGARERAAAAPALFGMRHCVTYRVFFVPLQSLRSQRPCCRRLTSLPPWRSRQSSPTRRRRRQRPQQHQKR